MSQNRYDKLCPILNAKVLAQSTEEVPVIVQFNREDCKAKEQLKSYDLVEKELPIIGAVSGYLTTDLIYQLANDPNVKYISFDSKVYTLLDIATESMEVYFPHDKGYEGEGITVAVIDTGVAPHNDLVKPENRIIGFKDFINYRRYPYDDNGHGTHVAGIIAGNGYSSRGKYVGVAPKANILAIKALDRNGGGSTSKVIEAISYIIETKDRYNTRVINLSIGTPANSLCEKDPLCRVVDRAINEGLVVVVAAGNSGPSPGTILSPGINRNAITVGAVDDKRTVDPSDDTIARFSSRGPTLEGIQKPDLVAPGVSINSLSNTKLNSYIPLSGTSMATPLVTGSVALLLDKYGDLKPSEVKARLLKACVPIDDIAEHQGAGVLNLKKLFDDSDEEGLRGDDDRIRVDSIEKGPVLQEDVVAASKNSNADFYEGLLVLLFILILLDSRF